MANIKSIHSVCNSLVQFLHHAYEACPVPDGPPGTFMPDEYPCNFRVLSSGELKANADFGTTLSLYLYRVLINEHARSRSSLSSNSPAPLTVDLHFFITVWAESAAAEQTICAWAMQQLQLHPILDVSSLTQEGGWAPDEMVRIIPAELSNEDLMRIWDALAPDYRLTVPYIARVIRIDAAEKAAGAPVVATRYQYQDIPVAGNNDDGAD